MKPIACSASFELILYTNCQAVFLSKHNAFSPNIDAFWNGGGGEA